MLLETVRLPEEFLTKVAAKFLHGVVGIMFLVVVLPFSIRVPHNLHSELNGEQFFSLFLALLFLFV